MAALCAGFFADRGQAVGTAILRCTPNHTAFEDPIVSPGVFPTAHMHEFSGNTSTGKDSTYESMTAADSTCRLSADTAGYWQNMLVRPDGTPQPSIFTFAYYKIDANDVAFAPDFRLVFGGDTRTFWSCFKTGGRYFDTIPHCSGDGNYLVSRVKSPDCWDGRLDSPDHRSHVAYKVSGRCDAGHPIGIPFINFFVRHCEDCGGPDWHLSDGTNRMHVDFWNTWQQDALEALIDRCRFTNCGQVHD